MPRADRPDVGRRVMTLARPVLVVGNCTVDLSFAVPRFPKPGETILATDRRVDLGGKGANQAIVARRAGVETTLAVPIGLDPDGDWAARKLVAEGLPETGILRTSTATDQSILYIVPGGENSIVSSHAAAACASPEWVEEVVAGASGEGILLMQGNLSFTATAAALAAARRRGMTTAINPAPIQFAYDELLPLADLVIANRLECVEIGAHANPERAARAMQAKGAGIVIVTLGAEGALVVGGDDAASVPAPVVEAVDTVGAGDVFCGVLVACLARDPDLLEAVATAVEAAAIAVTRRGTLASFPSRAESMGILERHGYRT